MENILNENIKIIHNKINKIFNENSKTKGLRTYLYEENGIISFTSFINSIIICWDKLDMSQKEKISLLLVNIQSQKNYLGDIKWVLYQYICDLNKENIYIYCGSYAYDKITKMSGFEEKKACSEYNFNLNGERVTVYGVGKEFNLNKKQIIISERLYNDIFIHDTDKCEYKINISPEDIILYFA